MPEPTTPPLLQAALRLATAGLSVVPARPDGSKAPIGSWKVYQAAPATPEQLASWLGGGDYDGIGVVCGRVSGDLEMVELEGRAVDIGVAARAAEWGLGGLWARVVNGYAERTPGGGIHVLLRCPDGVPGNMKLARRKGDGGVEVLAETRGEGGYVIVAPSGGRTHPTGGSWTMLAGGPEQIAAVTADELAQLHLLLASFDELPEAEPASVPVPLDAALRGDGPDTFGDYNARTAWDDLLGGRGWRRLSTVGGTTYWRRPGKTAGVSATTGRNDADNLYVFSTSTEFQAEKAYSKAAAYALLEHGGDYRAAGRELYRLGYGRRPAQEAAVAVAATVPSGGDEQAATAAQEDEPGRERTSWWRRDLGAVLDGDDDAPVPTVGRRTDGLALFYPGLVNGLIGESESGKTWVALATVAQVLDDGGRVLYVDFEDTAGGIIGRLRTLGADPAAIRDRFVYVEPDEGLHAIAAEDFAELLDAAAPTLAVFDGVNAAMQLMGLDINSNNDATAFAQKLMRPVAKRGIVVLYVDHVPKNSENRAKGGIGAQAKRAMTTGCCILVDKVKEFGVGTDGMLRLTVDKDRPGAVRGASAGARRAGTVHLEHDDGLAVRFEPPEEMPRDDSGRPRPTHLMERVSLHLQAVGEEMSKNQLRRAIKGENNLIDHAVDRLLDEGYVTLGQPRNGGLTYRFVRVFSDLIDLVAPSPPTSPRRGHGEVAARSRQASEPRRGEVGAPLGAPPGGGVASGGDVAGRRGRHAPCVVCGIDVDLALTRGELRHPACPPLILDPEAS